MTDMPEVGDILKKVKVIAVGVKGDGIVKTEVGFIIFVKGAKKGDVVNIEVKKVFEKFAFAEIVE